MSAPISESASPQASADQSPKGHPWHGWKQRERPLRLERRLEFSDYEATRVFLEQAAAVSEEMDLYPNLSFGRTYVNLTIFADDDSGQLPSQAEAFIERIELLLPAT